MVPVKGSVPDCSEVIYNEEDTPSLLIRYWKNKLRSPEKLVIVEVETNEYTVVSPLAPEYSLKL